jgi:two-component sensor histidine kinase
MLFSSGVLAFLSAAWRSLISMRIQVFLCFVTALFSAITAKGGDLTSALPLILGLILSLEYNFGRRSLIACSAIAFIVYPLALGWGYSRYSAAYLSQATAGVLGLFFFVAVFGGVIVRHRAQHREEAERLESRVKERTKELQALLDERAAMLREIHHRVKNNLQLIASLLRLESDRIEDPAQRRPFNAGIERVDAIAMAHDSLYVADRLDLVDLGVYVSRVLQSVSQESLPQVDFELSVSGEPRIRLDHAVSFGLLLHELVANVRDHAYPDKPGKGQVSLKAEAGAIELRVADEGVGLPPATPPVGGIGLPLAKALAEQLEGTLTQSTIAPNGKGTAWLLRFISE